MTNQISARVIPHRQHEYGHTDHLLIVERGDPGSDAFERVELCVTAGILGERILSLSDPEQVGARESAKLRRSCLALVGWLCSGSGLRVSEDDCLTSARLLRELRREEPAPDFEPDHAPPRARRFAREWERFHEDFLEIVKKCSLDDVEL